MASTTDHTVPPGGSAPQGAQSTIPPLVSPQAKGTEDTATETSNRGSQPTTPDRSKANHNAKNDRTETAENEGSPNNRPKQRKRVDENDALTDEERRTITHVEVVSQEGPNGLFLQHFKSPEKHAKRKGVPPEKFQRYGDRLASFLKRLRKWGPQEAAEKMYLLAEWEPLLAHAFDPTKKDETVSILGSEKAAELENRLLSLCKTLPTTIPDLTVTSDGNFSVPNTHLGLAWAACNIYYGAVWKNYPEVANDEETIGSAPEKQQDGTPAETEAAPTVNATEAAKTNTAAKAGQGGKPLGKQPTTQTKANQQQGNSTKQNQPWLGPGAGKPKKNQQLTTNPYIKVQNKKPKPKAKEYIIEASMAAEPRSNAPDDKERNKEDREMYQRFLTPVRKAIRQSKITAYIMDTQEIDRSKAEALDDIKFRDVNWISMKRWIHNFSYVWQGKQLTMHVKMVLKSYADDISPIVDELKKLDPWTGVTLAPVQNLHPEPAVWLKGICTDTCNLPTLVSAMTPVFKGTQYEHLKWKMEKGPIRVKTPPNTKKPKVIQHAVHV